MNGQMAGRMDGWMDRQMGCVIEWFEWTVKLQRRCVSIKKNETKRNRLNFKFLSKLIDQMIIHGKNFFRFFTSVKFLKVISIFLKVITQWFKIVLSIPRAPFSSTALNIAHWYTFYIVILYFFSLYSTCFSQNGYQNESQIHIRMFSFLLRDVLPMFNLT